MASSAGPTPDATKISLIHTSGPVNLTMADKEDTGIENGEATSIIEGKNVVWL